MRALASTLAALLLAACSTPVPIHFGPRRVAAPVVVVSNPSLDDGDPVAGRRAFIELQCIDCHRVASDPTLPVGRRAIAGPVLRGLDQVAPKEIARRITNRETGAGEDLLEKSMKDYTQRMTARQLVDVVAYLHRPEKGD